MNILYFIAFMLTLIFIALTWRFLLVISGIFVALAALYFLFAFVRGVISGFRDLVAAEG